MAYKQNVSKSYEHYREVLTPPPAGSGGSGTSGTDSGSGGSGGGSSGSKGSGK